MKAATKLIMLLLIVILTYSFLTTQAASEEKKVLRMGCQVSDIRTLDPHYAVATPDVGCIDVLYNSLVRFPYDKITFDMKKVVGDLAERWEVSKDGLAWTFYLRKGVKFHKGYGELTSEDVKFSLEKVADPKISAFASTYSVLGEVEALDKYTVRVNLKRRIPSIMMYLTNFKGGLIVSKKAYLEKGEKFKFDPIGTGPFMFESYEPKVKATLVRFPDYYEGKPRLDAFEVWLMPEAASREMAFRAGHLDILECLRDQTWVNKIKEIPGTVVDAFGVGESFALFFNVTKKPFDDIRVRQAICYGVNTREVRDYIGRDLTREMDSPIPKSFWGYSDKIPKYPFDPQKAKQLLKEAGYPEGLKLNMVMTESMDYRGAAEQIQEQLRRIGVDLTLQIVGHSTFHSQIRKDVNLMNYYSAFNIPVADAPFQRAWHSASIIGKPTADVNFSHYDKVDKEIEMAREALDDQQRLAYWAEAQRKIMEDAACAPIVSCLFAFARKSYVKYGYPEVVDAVVVTPRIIWKTDIVK